MTTRGDIRGALKQHGPLSITELAQHCPSCANDRQIVASAIATLRSEGKVKGFGFDAGNKPVYSLDQWPENETADEQAPVRAPEPAIQPSPTRPAALREEPTMAVNEAIAAALKAHGPLSLIDLRKHTKVVAIGGTLAKMVKGGLIEKRGPGAGVYALAGNGAPPRKAAQKKTKKAAPAKRVNGSAPYAAALEGLHGKRAELVVELEKVDNAIRSHPGVDALTHIRVDKTRIRV